MLLLYNCYRDSSVLFMPVIMKQVSMFGYMADQSGVINHITGIITTTGWCSVAFAVLALIIYYISQKRAFQVNTVLLHQHGVADIQEILLYVIHCIFLCEIIQKDSRINT